MKKTLLLSLIGIFILISSCTQKFEIEDPITVNQVEETTMDNLVVSPNFNWKTYNDINLTLQGNSNGIVKVVSSNGVLYQQAYLSSDKAYEMKLTVPTHITSVHLQYNDQNIPIDISSGNAEYTFVEN